jgi:hypothetical protein
MVGLASPNPGQADDDHSSSTVTTTMITTARTPATRHVPRGHQISCHAVNSLGLIGYRAKLPS